MRKQLKKLIHKAYEFNYHRSHKNSAMKALKHIEREKGKTNPMDLKLAKEYAKNVLGSNKYAPWLYVYTAIAGEFKEGWITDNYYGEIVIPKLKGDYKNLGDRNILTNPLLRTTNSVDICYFINQMFWTTDFKAIDEKNIYNLLFKNNEQIVFKIENSSKGKGVYFFNKENFSLINIKKLGNGVFQNYIKQHPFFSKISKSSVATIRITTTCDDKGNLSVNAGFLRVGRNKDTHIKTTTTIRIPINMNDGALFQYGLFPNWETTQYHPDSETIFRNKIIPPSEKCKTEVLKMPSNVPFIRCIG